jgi:hypothetical protein
LINLLGLPVAVPEYVYTSSIGKRRGWFESRPLVILNWGIWIEVRVLILIVCFIGQCLRCLKLLLLSGRVDTVGHGRTRWLVLSVVLNTLLDLGLSLQSPSFDRGASHYISEAFVL